MIMDQNDAMFRADERARRQRATLRRKLWNASLWLEAARNGADRPEERAGLEDSMLAVREARRLLSQ